MEQGVVSTNKGDTVNQIIWLLVFGLALWLGYETWFKADSTLSITQPTPALSTTPATSRHSTTSTSRGLIQATEANRWPAEEIISANDVLERLELWRYFPSDSLTAADINEIKRELTYLAQLGPQAVSTIYQFLNSGQDVDFEDFGNGRHLNQPTLRLALFEVLHRIGGDEAEAIWAEELDHTTIPREIAALSRYLDDQAPGAYRESIAAAARQALSLATADGINGENAGPLFQLLAKHSDENTLTELQQQPQRWWYMYTTVALASQPDSAGMTDLARQALSDPERNVRSHFALNMLAQHAEDAMAQSTLIELAGNKRIPGRQWQELVQFLTGTYQIQIAKPAGSSSGIPIRNISKIMVATPGGGQTLYGVRYRKPNLSDAQLAARLELLDALNQAAATPEAKQILAQAYEQLWNSYEMAEASQQ